MKIRRCEQKDNLFLLVLMFFYVGIWWPYRDKASKKCLGGTSHYIYYWQIIKNEAPFLDTYLQNILLIWLFCVRPKHVV